jgi:hypothetical protein
VIEVDEDRGGGGADCRRWGITLGGVSWSDPVGEGGQLVSVGGGLCVGELKYTQMRFSVVVWAMTKI